MVLVDTDAQLGMMPGSVDEHLQAGHGCGLCRCCEIDERRNAPASSAVAQQAHELANGDTAVGGRVGYGVVTAPGDVCADVERRVLLARTKFGGLVGHDLPSTMGMVSSKS